MRRQLETKNKAFKPEVYTSHIPSSEVLYIYGITKLTKPLLSDIVIPDMYIMLLLNRNL